MRKISYMDKDSSSGFTLVELSLVLAIFTILLSVVIFSYSQFLKSTKIDTDCNKITAVLNAAREMSISINSTHRVAFSLSDPKSGGKQSFWIDQLNYDTTGTPYWVNEVSRVAYLSDRVKITDVSSFSRATEYIQFYPDASAEGKRIHLIGTSEDSTVAANYFTIRIYSSTGRAQIIPYANY